MAKKKIYAVRNGRNPGIYSSWSECEEQIKGFPGQEYKGFSNLEEAQEYLNNTETGKSVEKTCDMKSQVEIDSIIKECLDNNRVVAFTDGGYREKDNIYGYGIYILSPIEEKPIEICNIVHTERFHHSRNIGPEVMAVINALDWALSNEYEKITIFYDYEAIGKWAQNEWKARTDISKWFVDKLTNTYNDLLDIEYIWVKGHNDIEYNEKADKLATEAMNKHINPQIKFGRTYFTCKSVNEKNVELIIKKLAEDPEIHMELGGDENKKSWKLAKLAEKTSITFFKKTNATVVQGKPNALFSLFISFYTELIPDLDLVTAYSKMRQRRIDINEIDEKVKQLNLPSDYPKDCIKLIKQTLSEYFALSNNHYDNIYDFGHYIFPACRALEGTIKYLFEKSGVHISNQPIGSYFDLNGNNVYYLKGKRFDTVPHKIHLEDGYNVYHSHRHALGHFGELFNDSECDSTTYMIDDKDEAISIIDEILGTIKFD